MNLNICKHSGYTITTIKEVAVSNISQTLKKSIWIVGDPQMEADGNKQVVSRILKVWTSYPKPWAWIWGHLTPITVLLHVKQHFSDIIKITRKLTFK